MIVKSDIVEVGSEREEGVVVVGGREGVGSGGQPEEGEARRSAPSLHSIDPLSSPLR